MTWPVIPTALTIWLCPCVARPGCYAAVLGSRDLCVSREPLFCAARKLITEGMPASVVLETRHIGSPDIVATRMTASAAARLTIEETSRDGLRRVPFNPARHGAKVRIAPDGDARAVVRAAA